MTKTNLDKGRTLYKQSVDERAAAIARSLASDSQGPCVSPAQQERLRKVLLRRAQARAS